MPISSVYLGDDDAAAAKDSAAAAAAAAAAATPPAAATPDTPNTAAAYADNVTMAIHILCRYPICRLVELGSGEWPPLKLRDSPCPELRFFIKVLLEQLHPRAESAAVALLYLSRFCQLSCAPVYFKHILGAFILSNKFHDDHRISLKQWSLVSRIPVAELIAVELELLESLDWQINVSLPRYYWWGTFLHKLLLIERWGQPGA